MRYSNTVIMFIYENYSEIRVNFLELRYQIDPVYCTVKM